MKGKVKWGGYGGSLYMVGLLWWNEYDNVEQDSYDVLQLNSESILLYIYVYVDILDRVA